MTRPPPPRYRVVERGRRLEVIDTRGEPPRRRRAGRSPLARGDEWRFTTRIWFDDKGPRRITLDADDVQRLQRIAAPLVVLLVAAVAGLWWLGFAAVVPVGIAVGAISQHARPWLTRRFDRYADLAQPPGG